MLQSMCPVRGSLLSDIKPLLQMHARGFAVCQF